MRHQLPVHSPLTLDALLAGARAMLSPGGGAAAAERVASALAERYAPESFLLTDSGTSALTLALRAASALHATPVALPAYCCYDVATAAIGAGVPVLLYDLDPLTLGPNFASLQRALQRGARAVVVAHLYGVPVDLDWVQRLAAEHGALVVEDAAQGTGTAFGGRPAGSLGSLGVLSFGRGKGATGGGGGALLANDESGRRALDAVRQVPGRAPLGVRLLVASVAQWLLARPEIYGLPASLPFLGLGETAYREPSAPTAPARFILGTLARTWPLADAETRARRRNAGRILEVLGALQPAPVVPLRGAGAATPGWLRLPALAVAGRRDALLGEHTRRLGIMPGYPRALPELEPLHPFVENGREDFAGARHLASELLTLPTHGRLDERDLAALLSWLRQTAGRLTPLPSTLLAPA